MLEKLCTRSESPSMVEPYVQGRNITPLRSTRELLEIKGVERYEVYSDTNELRRC